MDDNGAEPGGGPLPPVILCIAIILMALLHVLVPERACSHCLGGSPAPC